jgi:glycosyltransferase involved in cell wall biosynthesis
VKLLCLISGWQTPSSRFRVLQYVPHLRGAGHVCHVAAARPAKYEHYAAIGWRASGALRRVNRAVDVLRASAGRYDAVLVERELFDDDQSWGERLLRRVARRLVLDVDDAVFLLHPRKFERIAPWFDQIVAGNGALAAWLHARNPATTVIPTCVDLSLYPPAAEARGDVPVVGWMGTRSNLRHLKLLAEPLRALAAERRFELRLVTNAGVTAEELRQATGLHGVDVRLAVWSAAGEVDDLRCFDIGLMPLVNDDWSRYKCGLKAIQYLAVGVPAVVSPVGVNRDIVLDGVCGYWADGPGEWSERLGRLLDDRTLRARLGAAGREHVERNYSLSAHFEAWVEAVRGPALGANRPG